MPQRPLISTEQQASQPNAGIPTLLPITSRRLAPGIWPIDVVPSDGAEQAHHIGWTPIVVDLSQVKGKDELLSLLATEASFPSYFANNWDATADCLRDLSWIDGAGYLLIFSRANMFQATNPDLSMVLLDVLNEAIDHWTSLGVPFYVLWEGQLKEAGR